MVRPSFRVEAVGVCLRQRRKVERLQGVSPALYSLHLEILGVRPFDYLIPLAVLLLRVFLLFLVNLRV